MTATISSLPEDLIEEIISRVDLKDMRAVRLTCKKWETLSKSRAFTKMHIGKLGQGESRMVVLMDDSLYLMSVVVDDDPPTTERQGKLACLNDSGQVIRFSQILNCEGLVLCILKDDTRVVVWNPYWGQTRWIQPRFSFRPCPLLELFMYALGYEKRKSCRSYKFLRFIDTRIPSTDRMIVYEIYDFDSDTWTTLDVDPQWHITAVGPGASLKGNTYWGAARRGSSPGRVDHMICFDFTREIFGPLLPLPSGPKDAFDVLVSLSCVRQEKLAALFYHIRPSEIEIWITAKIEAETEISWTKLFTVDAGPYASIPIAPRRGCFFIDEVKKVAVLFDKTLRRRTVTIIEFSGSVRVLDLGEHPPPYASILMHPYVPSLVQLKRPARRKRKRQGSLESRRFNRTMLRFPMFEQFATTGKRTKTAKP